MFGDWFELASASVQGKEHVRTGRNNQDAVYVHSTDQYVIAVVADGCGSSPHSEVGAQLGVRMAAKIIAAEFGKHGLGSYPWINHALVSQLNLIKRWLGGDPLEAIRDYLLFTLVGVIITPEWTEFFAFGDGVVTVNGELFTILPPQSGDDASDNAPAYPAYQLFEPGVLQVPADELTFRLIKRLRTDDLDSFLIGTDGVSDLVNAEGQRLPGKSEVVKSLSTLWNGDDYFCNPDNLRRYLTRVNQQSIKLDRKNGGLVRETGLLPDDTTLVVGRRRTEAAKCNPISEEKPLTLMRRRLFSRGVRPMFSVTGAKP